MRSKFTLLTLFILSLFFLVGAVGCDDPTTISGTVRQDSQPMSGITVRFELDGNFAGEQTTGTSGKYTFSVQGPGLLIITPVSDDLEFEPSYQEVTLTAQGDEISNIDFNTGTAGQPSLAERLQSVIDRVATDPAYLPAPSGLNYTPLGISAAVYSPTHGLWQGVAGLQEAGGTPVTSDMLFGIGSITKTFVMALALTYCEDPNNPLDLTDTIGCINGQTINNQCWFSETELPSPTIIPRDITVEELLFQTSNLRDVSRDNITDFRTLIQNNPSPADLIANHTEPAFNGQKDFVYCNLNYTILGVMLEKVIGPGSTVAQEINNLLAARALSLPHTYMTYPNGLPASEVLARGHGYIQSLWLNERSFLTRLLLGRVSDETLVQMANYAGSMVSRPEDLINWSIALYEDTGNGSSLILSSANRALMLRNLPNYTYPPKHYGAGTFFYDTNTVGHGGSNFVYLGLMKYNLSTHEAVVVLLNKDEPFNFEYYSSGAINETYNLPLRDQIEQLLLEELHR